MDYAVSTKNLTKRYGQETSVDHVDLHVPEGTVKSRLHQARERLREEWEVRGE